MHVPPGTRVAGTLTIANYRINGGAERSAVSVDKYPDPSRTPVDTTPTSHNGDAQSQATPDFRTLTELSVSLMRVAPHVFALPAISSFPTGLATDTMS